MSSRKITLKDSNLELTSMLRSLIIVLVFTSLCQWTSIDAIEPLTLADSLYIADSYDAAITEYKRHLFFASESNHKPENYFRLGLCYRNLGEWVKARAFIRIAIELQDMDSIRSAYNLELAITDIASGNYGSAEINLLKLSSFSNQPTYRYKSLFFLQVVYIYQAKWDDYRKLLNSELVLQDTTGVFADQVLLEMISNNNNSGVRAQWLSTFVPGLGQLYSGYPLSAIKAVTINGITGYFAYDRITSGADLIDISYWLFAFHRFWSGSRNQTSNLIKQDRIKQNLLIRQEILHALKIQLR